MRLRFSLTIVAVVAMLGGAFAALGGAGTKTATTSLGGGDHDSVTVRCKQGQRVVAAGARGEAEDVVMKGQELIILSEVARPGKRRVRASGANLGGQDGDLTALARCKKQPKSKPESASITVPPAGMDPEAFSVTAKCPKGKRIVFGGFRAEQRPQDDPDNPIVIPSAAKKQGARAWVVEGWNLADGPDDAGELSSLVYCGETGKTEARTKTITTGDFEVESVDARCPRGTKLRYGGFDGTDVAEGDGMAAAIPVGAQRIDNRTFRVTQFAFGAAPAEMTAIAYCR